MKQIRPLLAVILCACFFSAQSGTILGEECPNCQSKNDIYNNTIEIFKDLSIDNYTDNLQLKIKIIVSDLYILKIMYPNQYGPSDDEIAAYQEKIEEWKQKEREGIEDRGTRPISSSPGPGGEKIPHQIGIVKFGPVKLRKARSATSRWDAVLNEGDFVRIVSETDEWYGVVDNEGNDGYVFVDFVEKRYFKRISEIYERIQSDLDESIHEMEKSIKNERAEYKTPAFRCREELEICRSEYGFLDCDLTMIICLFGVITGAGSQD